jgi:hypothetical protein
VLSLRLITAKFLPRLPNNGQKQHHFAVCSELKDEIENGTKFITINTVDESWVYGYDTETMQ